jgi:hypothetical protein
VFTTSTPPCEDSDVVHCCHVRPLAGSFRVCFYLLTLARGPRVRAACQCQWPLTVAGGLINYDSVSARALQ